MTLPSRVRVECDGGEGPRADRVRTMPAMNEQDERRSKPRRSVVMSPDGWEMAEEMSAAVAMSLSGFLEKLVRDEYRRQKKRGNV